MEDSLVIEEGMLVKFPLGPFCHMSPSSAAPAQGFFFHQEEVKQPHFRHTQRPNIMNCLGPPEAPDYLPLANPPYLPEQCNHCGKNF